MAGTSAEPLEGTDDEEEYRPPCREAGMFIAPCPMCGRQLRLKTLRYSHVCGRSFNVDQRAAEQQLAAEKAIKLRMASMKQPAKQRVEHQEQAVERPLEKAADKRHNYANLIRF